MKTIVGLLLGGALMATPVIAAADGVHGHVYAGIELSRGLGRVHLVFYGPAGMFSTVTDTRGFFSLISLVPGSYAIQASAPGYQAPCAPVVMVEPDEVATLTVFMIGSGAHVDCLARQYRPALVDPNATADVYNIH